jgi:hypothetical protein
MGCIPATPAMAMAFTEIGSGPLSVTEFAPDF